MFHFQLQLVNSTERRLKLWYKVISEDEHTYLIDNDHAYTKRLAKNKFLSQEELRQLKLEKLGI